MDVASAVNLDATTLEFRLIKVETAGNGSLTSSAQSRVEHLAGQVIASEKIEKLYYGQKLEDPTIVVFCAGKEPRNT